MFVQILRIVSRKWKPLPWNGPTPLGLTAHIAVSGSPYQHQAIKGTKGKNNQLEGWHIRQRHKQQNWKTIISEKSRSNRNENYIFWTLTPPWTSVRVCQAVASCFMYVSRLIVAPRGPPPGPAFAQPTAGPIPQSPGTSTQSLLDPWKFAELSWIEIKEKLITAQLSTDTQHQRYPLNTYIVTQSRSYQFANQDYH